MAKNDSRRDEVIDLLKDKVPRDLLGIFEGGVTPIRGLRDLLAQMVREGVIHKKKNRLGIADLYYQE